MANYTYTGNRTPGDQTGEIILRSGALRMKVGQYADLTDQEYAALKDRFNLVAGTQGQPATAATPLPVQGATAYVQPTKPTPPAGQKALWFDSSQGLAAISLVDDQGTVSPLPVGSGGVKKGVYVPSDWATSFWTPAKAAAGSQLARLAVIGDSISQLLDASTYEKSWVGLMRAALQTKYGDGGSGFMGGTNTPTASTGLGNWTRTITLANGVWANNSESELSGKGSGPGASTVSSNTTGATATISGRGRYCRIFWGHNTAASTPYITAPFSYAVDGGAAVTITPDVPASGNAFTDSTLVDCGTDGPHTIVLTVVTGGTNNYFILNGVRFYGTSGVVVDNYARSGAMTATFLKNSTHSAPVFFSGGPNNPADLTIVALGVNDAHQGVTADTFEANLYSILKSLNDGVNQGATATGTQDLLILRMPIGSWDAATPRYGTYAPRALGLAQAFGAAYVDLDAYFRNSRNYLLAQNYFSDGHTGTGAAGTDAVHPSDAGHQMLWDAIKASVPQLIA